MMRKLLPFVAILLTAAGPQGPVLRVTVPDGDGLLADRDRVSADAVNSNCLACHSAGMITAQPRLTRLQWGETLTKMRTVYAAPIAPEDDAAILDYLAASPS